ncbi:MlaD family protein [Antrihabitans stalactiti]|jgi:phospholipid/cholesterol/gamma-HCH transport system substrate-binding protein|uniref:MCE family protein n=1 Tax=Antrihabitans stalactiti TaxID=2584121 RepID=A0A848KHD2_9NOCA|nr:MlaD family protein [Antrihabitans stalactiti]NMN97571.1 MCE family protein [Antrihabitans stalactiti]
MKSVVQVAWKLMLFTVVIAVLLVFVVQAVKRPVSGDTHDYSAVFTDANGLKSGDDVRMYGVQVGKVQSIALDANQAVVRFTLQRGRAIYDSSKLAIRYQNLTGQRYVDIQQPAVLSTEISAGTTIGTSQTIASFDITALFNGLEPVLAEFSPGALNQFAETMLAVIEGNGAGIGPALESIEKLSNYVTDRQAVISVLVSNLRAISDKIGGKSAQLVSLITKLSTLIATLHDKIGSIIEFALIAPPILGPINNLLATLGLTTETNPDFDTDIKLLFPDPQHAVEVLGRLPALLQTLNALIPDTGPGVNLACTNGNVSAPGPLQMLIGGQRISICKR